MYKLMVSKNAGMSYHERVSADTIETLGPACNSLDEQGLRWYIEDGDGEMLLYPICLVYKNILYPSMTSEEVDEALRALAKVEGIIEDNADLIEELSSGSKDGLDNQ